MALEFQNAIARFRAVTGFEQSTNLTANFSRNIRTAEVALKGFFFTYNNGDHHLLQSHVEVFITHVQDRTVAFTVKLLLRDNSGNIDDPYSGQVEVLLIADTV